MKSEKELSKEKLDAISSHIEFFKVRHSEGNRNGILKLRTLFDYAQEVAAIHADNLGVGMKYLLSTNRAWILSRIQFEFKKQYPTIGDLVKVETYPRLMEKLIACREFIFYDQNEEIWATASSQWLLLDIKTLRPLRVNTLFEGQFPDNSDRPLFFPEIKKLALPIINEQDIVLECIVRESQLDVNQHLNNAEYAAWVQDFLSLKMNSHKIHLLSLQINFIHACFANTKVHIKGNIDAEHHFLIAGFIWDNEQQKECVVFQATGQISPIE